MTTVTSGRGDAGPVAALGRGSALETKGRTESASTETTPVRDVAEQRERRRTYTRNLIVIDAVVIMIAILGGYLTRFVGPLDRFDNARPTGSHIPYALLGMSLALVWLLSLAWMRCYDDRALGYGSDEYRRVISATLRLAGTIAIAGYLADVGVSRGFLGITFAVGTVALPGARYLTRKRLHHARAKGRGWSRRVLVVGDAAHVLELVHQLDTERYAGYDVVGACIPDSLVAPVAQRLDDVPVVGSFRNILGAASAVCADTVAVTGSAELTGRRLRRLGWQMEGTGIDLVLAPSLMDVAGPRIHTRPIAGLPLIHVESPEFSGGRKALKGLVDRVGAFVVLALGSPLLPVVALAIKLDSRGPVFFQQTRVGRDGKEFRAYKFRSMVVDAEEIQADLAEHNDHDGVLFKIRADPRVTRVGRLLRKWSIDELPQFMNVLIGQMSMVGPRPPLPAEVAQYDPDVARRLLVKPGITGLWQVSGRSDLSWEESVRLDLYYVENWSLTADLTILWKTIGAVIRGRGAY
jgi:exopolysaccharide biosynthesis polyprenyl glycosylphosphotransferase